MAQKLTDEQIESAAREALQNSLGGENTSIARARLRNIDFYNAEPKGELAPPEVEDRSTFVATDVADTVDGMLPALLGRFIGSSEAVSFEAQGQPGSEQEAKLATAYCNHIFFTRNDGLLVLHDVFHDALLQKKGYAQVWIEDEAEDSRQDYEGNTPEQLTMLLQDGWVIDGEVEQDPETGLLDFTVKKEGRNRCIKLAAVAPHEMRVDVNARWDAEPAMIGREFYKRRFEWEEDGFDVSSVGGERPFDQESLAMLGEDDDGTAENVTESHRLVRGAIIYIKLDADGDGVAEWLKVTLIGDQFGVRVDGEPAWEQVDDHPFVWFDTIPRPHSFFGDCPADRAIEAQRLRTRTVRSIEDAQAFTVNPRTYINTAANVNIDDFLDNRPGGAIRGQGPANAAIQPLAAPNLSAPAYQFNEFVASWLENRTGFNRYSAGTDQNALNKTKGGVELLTAKADMRLELMSRILAVGVRQMFAKILKLAIKYQNVPEMVKVAGQFVPINPSEFKNQYSTHINVGLGSGSKEQLMQRVLAMGDLMMKLGAPAGVVRSEHISRLIKLGFEANEFKNPENFVDDQPTGMPATPAQFQQVQQQAQQQAQAMQQEIQRLQQENQQLKQANDNKQGELAIKQGHLQVDAARAENEQRKTSAEILGQAHEAAEPDEGQVRDLQKQVAELQQQMDNLIAALSGPGTDAQPGMA